MSSVHICYNGSKKILKIAPNSSVHAVLLQAAELFSINSPDIISNLSLKHKKSALDNSMLFRYANIPNNSILDLISASSSTHNMTGSVKVALSVQTPALLPNIDSNSFILSFQPNQTILEVIDAFIAQNSLVPISSIYDSAEVIIMHLRRSIVYEQFPSTSLSLLGLSSGQSVRIQLRLKDSSIISDASTFSKDHMMASSNAASVESNSMVDDPVDLSTIKEDVSSSIQSPVTSIHDSINMMLTQNFDARSIPAILTISKYITNILSYPNDPKYRNIKLSNKVYQEKIACIPGASQVLSSIGFIVSIDDGIITLPSSIDIQHIQRVYGALQDAMNELNIPDVDRPSIIAPIISSTLPSQYFDIYKSSITRTAPQPSRTVSVTEAKLDQINKRRRELEGNPDEVSRETVVFMPHETKNILEDPAISSSSSSMKDRDNDMDDARYDRMITNTIAKKILGKNSSLSSGGNDDGPPLTTRAIRDLDKAMTERIYTRIVIRIKFPDRCQLQGYFHPHHKMADIYTWVRESLSDDVSSYRRYELYMSPPKIVLLDDDSRSLKELNMIPAAMIYLSWKDDMNMSSTASSTANSSDKDNMIIGGYFRYDLLQKDDKVSAGMNEYIPHGVKLVDTSSSTSSSTAVMSDDRGNDMKAGVTLSSSSSSDSSKTKSKPSWLKI